MFRFVNRVSENITATIGVVYASLNELKSKREYDIIDETNRSISGVMVVDELRIIEKPTFLSYLNSGWNISLTVAIDFTGSNGNPAYPSSLHYLGNYNQYEHAIGSVGTILECYDNDRSFPVYGFGGVPKYMGIDQTNHCFPLNGVY